MKPREFIKYAAKPLNIFILLCVLIFILLFSEGMLVQTFWSYKPHKKPAEPNNIEWKIDKVAKDFTMDGRIFLESSKGKEIFIYDTNFNKLWQGKPKERPEKYQSLEWARGFTGIDKSSFVEAQRITPEMMKSLEIPIRQNNKIKEIWRYLYDKNIFEGFEFNGEKIGCVCSNGFNLLPTYCEKFAKPVQFSMYVPKESENPILLWQTDKQLISIDLENRKKEILIDGGNQKISGIKYNNLKYITETYDANYRPMICYYTEDKNIQLMLNEPDEKITFTAPAEWDDYINSQINLTATKDSIFVFHYTSDIPKPKDFDKSFKIRNDFYKNYPFYKASNYSTQLYKLNKDGSLKLINEFKWTKPVDKNLRHDFQYYFRYASIISPPIFYAGVKTIAHLNLDVDRIFAKKEEGMMKGYIGMIEEFYPHYTGINLTLSAIMMFITFWHGWARKNNRFSFALWIIFVGLFGLAGLITYLLLNHTTTLKCQSCGKKRNLDTPECIRCGANLPSAKSLVICD